LLFLVKKKKKKKTQHHLSAFTIATEAEKNVAGSSIQRDESEIAHNYFEHTAIKDMKVMELILKLKVSFFFIKMHGFIYDI
jgi:hypothetical protein